MSDALSVHHGDFGRAALYRLDKPIVTHAHREGHLIFYLEGSRATVSVSGAPHPADETYGVAVSPWEPHTFDLDEPSSACVCLVLYIKPMWFLETSEFADRALNFGRSKIGLTPQVLRSVKLLTSLLLEEDNPAYFDKYLYETTWNCFNQSWSGCDQASPLAAASDRFTDFRVRRSLRIMQEKFSEDIEMEALARQAGLSRPHFFKLFKKQMGITPNIYLNTLRAEQAIEDLMATDKTVTDISYDLGFSSQASFTRFFTSNVGIPPSQYRRVAHLS
jgi:AraC-like DNA-binding protein